MPSMHQSSDEQIDGTEFTQATMVHNFNICPLVTPKNLHMVDIDFQIKDFTISSLVNHFCRMRKQINVQREKEDRILTLM